MKVDKNVKAFLSLSSLLIDPHNPEEIVFSLNVYIFANYTVVVRNWSQSKISWVFSWRNIN